MKNEYQERESRFLQMIRTMRPDGSKAHSAFCREYLEPVFGPPDLAGNYLKQIGPDSRIMFAAHSDTVHQFGGLQKIQIAGGMVRLHPKSKANCLGADCTTGVHIILEMIRANVPGLYAIFAAEEIGCLGSRAFVRDRLDELPNLECVISLDRKGYESVITHQMGARTASDKFARDMAGLLDLDLRPDPTGSYTDSNEFARHVSECTNLSVGYFAQHSAAESQDLSYLAKLTERMIRADWSQLRAYRDPRVRELDQFDDWANYRTIAKSKKTAKRTGSRYAELFAYESSAFDTWDKPALTMRDLVRDNPRAIADWLEDNGVRPDDLAQELGLDLMYGESRYGR